MAIRFGNCIHYLSYHILLLTAFFHYASAQDTLTVCNGESIVLMTTPGADVYDWTPTYFLNNPEIFNPKAKPFATTTYTVRGFHIITDNLVVNGNFSQDTLGMTTEYSFPSTAESTSGMIQVDNNPTTFNPLFPNCNQPSGDDGPMLIVDGSLSPNLSIWCQVIEVVPNTEYLLSAFATSLFNANHPQLQFYINNTQIGGNLYLSKASTCEWQRFSGYWDAGAATQAEICIVNQNAIAWGNDLAIDSIEFFGLQALSSDTMTVEVLPTYELDIDTAICAEMSLFYNGAFLPPGSSHTFNLTTQAGCDSIVNLSIALTDELFTEIRIDTLCPGDTLKLFGQEITRDTTICRTYSISPTCDSTFCAEVVFLSEAALVPEIQATSCAGFSDGAIWVNPVAGFPPFTFSWSDGMNTAQRQNLPAGNYTITITDRNGCTVSKEFLLPEPSPLIPNSEAMPTKCYGENNGSIQLAALGGTAPYVYAMEEFGFAPRHTFSNLSPGTYTVQIKDANGCLANETMDISESPEFHLTLPPEPTIYLGEGVDVEVYTIPFEDVTYDWSPAEGLSCTDCPNPNVAPRVHTTYQIKATNDQGCTATGMWQVLVEKNHKIYIPNAFSPNHDGRNDTFQVFAGANVESILSFQIFNRWGALVYSATDCRPSDAHCAWDGSFKGKPAQQGIYLYSLQTLFADGQVEAFDGEVLLLR